MLRASDSVLDRAIAGELVGRALHVLDRGARWIEVGEGLPTAAEDDIIIHPRERDLTSGTHGRNIHVLDDVTAPEQWTQAVAAAPITLFAPRPATAFHYRTVSGLSGRRMFTAKNAAFGADLNCHVKE